MNYPFSNFDKSLSIDDQTKLIIEYQDMHGREALMKKINEDTYNHLISIGYQPAKWLEELVA